MTSVYFCYDRFSYLYLIDVGSDTACYIWIYHVFTYVSHTHINEHINEVNEILFFNSSPIDEAMTPRWRQIIYVFIILRTQIPNFACFDPFKFIYSNLQASNKDFSREFFSFNFFCSLILSLHHERKAQIYSKEKEKQAVFHINAVFAWRFC